jgi:hypothetical protein
MSKQWGHGFYSGKAIAENERLDLVWKDIRGRICLGGFDIESRLIAIECEERFRGVHV